MKFKADNFKIFLTEIELLKRSQSFNSSDFCNLICFQNNYSKNKF